MTTADVRRRNYLEGLNSKREESKQQKMQRRIMSLKNLQRYIDNLEPETAAKMTTDNSFQTSPISKTHAKS